MNWLQLNMFNVLIQYSRCQLIITITVVGIVMGGSRKVIGIPNVSVKMSKKKRDSIFRYGLIYAKQQRNRKSEH